MNNAAVIDLTSHRNNTIAALAATAKKKNELLEQEFAYKLFERFPDTPEADVFFAEIRKRYVAKYTSVASAAAVVDNGEVVPSDSWSPTTTDNSPSNTGDHAPAASNDVDEDDGTDDGSYFDARGLFVPGGFARDIALDNVVEECRQPRVNHDFMEDDSLPPTQCLVEALQRTTDNVQDRSNNIHDDVVDSQLTTL